MKIVKILLRVYLPLALIFFNFYQFNTYCSINQSTLPNIPKVEVPHIYYLQINPSNITNNLIVYYKGNYFDVHNGKCIITSLKSIEKFYLLFTNPCNLPTPVLDKNKTTVLAMQIKDSKNYSLYHIKNLGSKTEITKIDENDNPTIVPEDSIIILIDPKFVKNIENVKKSNNLKYYNNLLKIDFSTDLVKGDIDKALLSHADLKPFHCFNQTVK